MENFQNDVSDIKNLLMQLKQKTIPDEEKKFFIFNSELKQEDIDEIINSKSENIKIVFKYNNFDNIFSNIELLSTQKSNINFKIELEEKNSFNNYIFNNLNKINDSNIIISNKNATMEDINLSEYIEYERTLINMISPAQNLSNFEKYLYAYNVVKNYKEYKKSNTWNESRSLYDILNSDYIVCAGYTRLLKDLLEKLGVESKTFSVIVLDEDTLDEYSHSIIQVNIKDEKYGIDGFFYGDPTNDNGIEDGKDYYIFSLMSADEMKIYKTRDVSNSHLEKFFMCCTMEDFFSVIDEWKNSKEINDNSLPHLLYELIKYIKEINYNIYEYLTKKYQLNDNSFSDEIAMRTLLEIGNYIVQNNNKQINKETFYSGVKEIYEQFYGFENKEVLQNYLNQVIQYNEEAKFLFEQKSGQKK